MVCVGGGSGGGVGGGSVRSVTCGTNPITSLLVRLN